MSGDDKVQIRAMQEGLLLSGEPFQKPGDWQLRNLGRQRFLVDRTEKPAAMRGDGAGFGIYNYKTFAALLYGLGQETFDGVISVDLGTCYKRLYMRQGELVFAASTLMDDRLGEVIYRAGLITLDQLTEAAVQVSRTTKFGKVLLDNHVFSTAQLWSALKLQVQTIFQSLFLNEDLYVQIDAGLEPSSTMVKMDVPTKHLIDDCQSYAEMIKVFRQRVNRNNSISKVEAVCVRLKAESGTFMGDTVDLATANGTVDGFLSHSKLTSLNSVCALFDMIHRHVLQIDGYDANLRGIEWPGLKEIKSQIDAYHLILDGAKKAFLAEGGTFPLLDIELFLEQQYSYSLSPVFVLIDGSIAPESVVSIYTKARTSHRQTQIMVRQMQSLVLFLLQLVGDLLPGGKGWDVKRTLQNMVT